MISKPYLNILGIVAGVAVAGSIVGLRYQGSFEQTELLAYDSFVRLNAKSGFDRRITIVGIDDNTLQKLNSDKISDRTLQQVLTTIAQHQPRVIGVDIIRDIPIGQGRKEFINYVNGVYHPFAGAIKPIIFPCALPSANRPSGIAPPPVIDPDSGVGFVDLETDPPNMFGGELVRRSAISSIPVKIESQTASQDRFDTDSNNYLCTAPFSFGFLTALSYFQAEQLEGLPPDIAPNLEEIIDLTQISEGQISVKSVAFSPLKPKTGSYRQLDPTVYQHLIDYRYTQPGEIISLTKVLENKVSPGKFKDKVVLIGYLTKEDIHHTPVGLSSGVMVHGWIVSQILSNVLDRVPLIWTWSEPVEWLWILGWGVTGSIVALKIRPTWLFVGTQGIAIALLWGSCWVLFTQQGWIPLVPPLFSLVASSIVVKAIATKLDSEEVTSSSQSLPRNSGPHGQPTLITGRASKPPVTPTYVEPQPAQPPVTPTYVEPQPAQPPVTPTYVEQQPVNPKTSRPAFVRQDPFIGQSIGDGDRYILEKLLGQGGMSKVYIALDKKLDRKKVAIKIMTSYFSANDQYLSKRFMGEVKDLCILNHPNIIQITDYGLTPETPPFSGYPFYVMEYFVGQTLQEFLDRNQRLSLNLALQIILKVCHGLKVAHQHGIVHRDLKPENIFLMSGGEVVKLIDFGIAKKIDEESEKQTKLTVEGTFLGTYRYASPEQCRGIGVDPRTDIYSLGVVLYEVISGHNPYNLQEGGDTTNDDWSVAHRRQKPLPLREQPSCQNLPIELENIVMKCLAKSPQNRFQTIEELEQALDKFM